MTAGGTRLTEQHGEWSEITALAYEGCSAPSGQTGQEC